MNKFASVSVIAIIALVAIVAMASASGYGSSGYGSSSGYGQNYGNNYDRKTGFKTVIYHPYGGVSNRFDYRTFPAYGNGYGPAPYIKTGLEYTIGEQGYGGNQGGYGQQMQQQSYGLRGGGRVSIKGTADGPHSSLNIKHLKQANKQITSPALSHFRYIANPKQQQKTNQNVQGNHSLRPVGHRCFSCFSSVLLRRRIRSLPIVQLWLWLPIIRICCLPRRLLPEEVSVASLPLPPPTTTHQIVAQHVHTHNGQLSTKW